MSGRALATNGSDACAAASAALGVGRPAASPAVAAPTFNSNVHRFVRHAIADSTRRSYEAARKRYRDYCIARSLSPLPQHITPASAACWLADLGAADELRSRTLHVYSSSLSHWFVESTLSDAPNPMQSNAVQRVLKGIDRDHREAEVKARAGKPATTELTPALLLSLEDYAPDDYMRWAAALTGTYGFLRPSELLGSSQHRNRALRVDQVRFFSTASSAIPCTLLPPGTAVDSRPFPDHFILALEITKADQQATNDPVPIAAAPAVRALWRWMHLRRDHLSLDTSKPVFCLASGSPLSCNALTFAVTSWLTQAGAIDPVVKGRTFRRGGASALMASGAAMGDVARAGRWALAGRMAETYTDEMGKFARVLETSRNMAP